MLEFFRLEENERGVLLATIDRPPVADRSKSPRLSTRRPTPLRLVIDMHWPSFASNWLPRWLYD